MSGSSPAAWNLTTPYIAAALTPERLGGLEAGSRSSIRTVRVSTVDKLLDRACGRPAQAVAGADQTGPVSFTLIEELHPVLLPGDMETARKQLRGGPPL
jgi:hypothetical protein